MKLSIITVCKNAVESIGKTIESVINQTFTDYEYIIVDGASTDGTVDAIKKYSERISKLITEPDIGIYDAMNKGINMSSGEYLMFLNAGDYFIHSSVLKRVFDYKLHGDIIYGIGLIEFSNGFIFRKTFPKKISKFYMFMDTIPHQDSLTRKIVFEKSEGFNSNFIIAGDYDFFIKSLYQNHFTYQYIPEAIAVNDLTGLSRKKKYKNVTKNERKSIAERYFTKSQMIIYSSIKPFYFLMIKYPKYLFNLINSILRQNSIITKIK
ncbi:MAG: glycosyltransferase family 2 protein [bacterium]